MIEDWPAYDRWNAAIADEFFAGRYGGVPVYLDLEDSALRRIADAAGARDAEDASDALIQVVRPTLYVLPRLPIFGAHRRRLTQWRRAGEVGPPPVLAVLALLSLIAERMTTDTDFRASNYYGRFLRTLGYPPTDEQLRQKTVRCFGEESHVLWAGLNDWLSEAPEVRGQPTAYAFDYRVHVGVPMSQALLREADREALRELFVDYRLSPRQQITHSDMLRLLRDWLPLSPLSSSLKLLCQQDEVLARVADIACIELEAWEGQSVATVGGTRSRLAFVAGYRRHPRPRLTLGLAVRVGGRQTRELLLGEDSGPSATQAMAGAGGRLVLAEPDASGWSDVINAGEVSIAHALVAALSMRGVDMQLRRIPRRLVVLERDDERRRYHEVDRARLGGEYILLAADTLGSLLDDALAESARPGWRLHVAGSVSGVPPGWTLYTGVELVGITSSQQIDLSALVPIAWTQLTLTAGLALPGRGNWLASAPPQVSASSLAGEPVEAVITPELSAAAEDLASASSVDDASGSDVTEPETAGEGADRWDHLPDPEVDIDGSDAPDELGEGSLTPREIARLGGGELLGRADPAAIFDLADLELEPGQYRVSLLPAEDGGLALSSIRLTLLGPDPAAATEVHLAHPVSMTGLGAISAQHAATGVCGADVPELDSAPADSRDAPDAVSGALGNWVRERADDDLEPDPVVGDDERPRVVLPTCMEMGAHYFKLPSTLATKGERQIHAVCEYCGIERFFPARPARRGFAAAPGSRSGRLAHSTRSTALPPRPRESDAADFDLVLEAISTMQVGDSRGFDRVLGQMDDRPWAATEALRMLSALGHVDVELDARTLRVSEWSVAPPTLVAIRAGAVLAGWRSESLLHALGHIAARLGQSVVREAMPDAPAVVSLPDIDDETLARLSAQLSERMALDVVVARNSASALLRLLPSLGELREALPSDSAPVATEVERFDPVTGSWSRAHDLVSEGGYRSLRFPRRFWHHHRLDWRVADGRIVKWLSAPSAGAMMAYDAGTRVLACHVGGQLPGLYERVAVLSSGYPPTPSGPHVLYRDVAPATAAGLARRLTSGGGARAV